MIRRMGIRMSHMILLGVVVPMATGGADQARASEDQSQTFAEQVDLDPLFRTAVQADGRIRSFESHAKAFISMISGSRLIHGQSNGFTLLDLIIRPDAYHDADIIYVKNKLVRQQIIDILLDRSLIDEDRARTMGKKGLISPDLLREPSVVALLDRLGQDLIRTAKVVDSIQTALAVSSERVLSGTLQFLPPDGADLATQWASLTDVIAGAGIPRDSAHAGMSGVQRLPGIDPELQDNIAKTWTTLASDWRKQDVPAVNAGVAKLADLLRSTDCAIYPSLGRLQWESWYFRHNSMTWVWLLYLVAALPLLMSTIYKWNGARKIGMGLFVVAFGFHTLSVALRWYISGRWPNSNMFEAVTTSVWFGSAGALILEFVARKSPMRNLFALGSSVMSMIALMAAYFLPTYLDSTIRNKMAALNDIWLYIHTNVIIWSYAIIGVACVPALLLLANRWIAAWSGHLMPRWRLLFLPLVVGVLHVSGYFLLMHIVAPEKFGLSMVALSGMLGLFAGATMVVGLELMDARERRLARVGPERAAPGGASSLILGVAGGGSFLKNERPTAGQVFDGATMVLVEVAFIMLFTGTIMGAIWADHSWGRPWGWDPKEVFALNTFFIFLILIHVRLKVKDKAFWTAVLAIIGFEVMMFNWIAVNFVITGLHSYA